MPRLRHPGNGVVVNVSDDTAARLNWPAADEPAAGPPPKVGRGSSRDAWAAYAASQGVDVDEDMTRAEIIEAVEG
jgi:hypothetical protein